MKKEKKKKNWFLVLAIFIIIVVIIFIYGRFINTSGLKVNEVAVYSKQLESNYNGLKIAQFSDVHLGRTTNIDDLNKVVKELNKLNADIVIFTGDLFDKENISKSDKKAVIKALKKIDAKLFKFAIIGDYDNKYLDTYKEILEDSNFILLDNENKLIYDNSEIPINFVGITKYQKNTSDLYTSKFNITLVHKPDVADKLEMSDVTFAGHSLGGQIIIPFVGGIIKHEGAKTYIDSHYVVNDKDLYISNGIGTQNISFRLFNKPSITLYRLYSK